MFSKRQYFWYCVSKKALTKSDTTNTTNAPFTYMIEILSLEKPSLLHENTIQ
ncbi:hypothetical protein BH09BAC3_BH09BAC3_37000 [soil metagenome]